MRDYKERITDKTICLSGFATVTTLKFVAKDLPKSRFVTVWVQPNETDDGWEVVHIIVSENDFDGDASFTRTGPIHNQKLKEKRYKILDTIAREMHEVFGAEAYVQIRLGGLPEKKQETKGKPKAARR